MKRGNVPDVDKSYQVVDADHFLLWMMAVWHFVKGKLLSGFGCLLGVFNTSAQTETTACCCEDLNFPLDHQTLSLLQAGTESPVEVMQKMWKKDSWGCMYVFVWFSRYHLCGFLAVSFIQATAAETADIIWHLLFYTHIHSRAHTDP